MGIKNPRVSLSGVFVGLWSNHLNYSLLLPIGIVAYIFAKFNIQSVLSRVVSWRLVSWSNHKVFKLRMNYDHAYAAVDSDARYRIIFCWLFSKLLTPAVHSFCLQFLCPRFATPRKMAASTDAYRRTDTQICKILFLEKAVYSSILASSGEWYFLSFPEAHADDC